MKDKKDYIAPEGYSPRVIQLFRSRGKTLKEIGALMGLSESFISRVARGERSLTMSQLSKLERNTGVPFHLLLIEAHRETCPPEHRQMLEEMIDIVRSSIPLMKYLYEDAAPARPRRPKTRRKVLKLQRARPSKRKTRTRMAVAQ